MNSLGQKPDKDNYKTTRAAINWSPLGFKSVHLRCQFLAPRSGALYRQESRKVQRATRSELGLGLQHRTNFGGESRGESDTISL